MGEREELGQYLQHSAFERIRCRCDNRRGKKRLPGVLQTEEGKMTRRIDARKSAVVLKKKKKKLNIGAL